MQNSAPLVTKSPEISKNLQDTILEMDRKRSWMSDYRKEFGWTKLDIIDKFRRKNTGDVTADAVRAKQLLNLEDDWYAKVSDLDHAFRFLKGKLEQAGILVMRNGIVGSNTHRSLDISEFRAFLLYDDLTPLIFINNNDSKAGKIFFLIHEYIHVLFEQEDIFLDPYLGAAPTERQINLLTAEVLMPQGKVLTYWKVENDVFTQIERLSNMLKVSGLALAIKLRGLGLIDREIVEKIRIEAIQQFETKSAKSDEVDFYKTYHSRMSTVFTEAVVRSAESGEIGYTEAFRLLGVKGKTYDNIKAEIMSYG
ncbi:MAG: ImmA/IrrE family metallo-endopeptidase [Firmicutes bacterium]|nr:ImmA/IrrE family metallo-endopeptidase [Bacillota bacterium]